MAAGANAEANHDRSIGAVVLAAGQSQRMGRPKLTLPWGERSVIEQVVATLVGAGIAEIVVVTGGSREAVEGALTGYPVRLAHNTDDARVENLSSLQVGIRALAALSCQALAASLVVLGDQPTIETGVVKAVIGTYRETGAPLVVPSYQMHRGHPWLVEHGLWTELLEMAEDQTMRDFLGAHEEKIAYVEVDSPGILKDMDTPEDYQKLRPN